MNGKQFLLILFVLVSFVSTKSFAATEFGESSLLGKEAPNFISKTLTQDKLSLNEYREGKKAIVFFWTTWCPYCRKEIETLSKKIDDLQKKGIKLILVNLGESPQKVTDFIKKNKIEIDVFLDQDSSIAQTYNVLGVPTFFYVNEKGVINAVENVLLDDYETVLSKE